MHQNISGVNSAHIQSKILIAGEDIYRLLLGGSIVVILDLCETGEVRYVLFVLLFFII